jgi:hypothetical protein
MDTNIATSLILDAIKLNYTDGKGQQSEVGLVRTGIAWESDKKYKFANPTLASGETLEQGKDRRIQIKLYWAHVKIFSS